MEMQKTEAQVLGEYLALDTGGWMTEADFKLKQRRKAELAEQLLRSPDEKVQRIAVRLQLDRNATNARRLIHEWLNTR